MTAVSFLHSSSDGDMLDAVVLAHYGDASATVLNLVLEANPGLAAYGPVWPEGLEVILPAYEPPAVQETAQLWG